MTFAFRLGRTRRRGDRTRRSAAGDALRRSARDRTLDRFDPGAARSSPAGVRLDPARGGASRREPADAVGCPAGHERFLAFLLATVVYGLLVAVGLALLILPGVLLAARLGFYGFAMAAEPLDPIAALRRSFEITRGSTVELVLFGFALLGINVLGALALGVGLLATVPTTAGAAAFVYRRFVPRHAGAEAELRAAS